jgi:hypothetical protein
MPTCARCSSPLAATDRFCPSCGTPNPAVVEQSPTMTVQAPASPPRPVSDPSSLGHGRFEPGTRLGPRFRIVGLLGRGGMGDVYRADDLELGQSVALKFLPERLRHDPEALARFRSEVRLARQISHQNIARVYDIAEAEGHVFLSMEYVDGEDLASVLRRMGRPSKDKAIDIARQLCLGIAAAHERGVLHRDLKPSNVMIDGRGRVRVMDFGLAALATDVLPEGQVVGTPAYMAPEQLAGGQVSVQSDLYALGLILHEICTGKRLYDTNDPAKLREQHRTGSIPTPSSFVEDMDPVFERVIVRCLETDPRQRPPSAYAVLGALPGGDPLAAAIAAGETPSPDLVANASDAGGLSPQSAGAMFFSVLALVCLSMWLFTHYYRPLRQSPTELSFRAASLLESLGYAPLPKYTASGFAVRPELVDGLEKKNLPGDSLATAGPGGLFFWRRFSVIEMDPMDIHRSIGGINDPPQHGPGSVTVALDVDGKLLGLWAVPLAPPDSAARRARPVSWQPLLAAAGLDTTRLVRDSSAWLPPVACDSTVRWTLAAPRPGRGVLRVRAGAAYGKATFFAIEDSLGSAIDRVGAVGGEHRPGLAEWLNTVWWWALNLAGILLARRNLMLSRLDRRGAMRLAGFVFFATVFETIFTYSIPERGLNGLIDSLLNDRALGHSLLHAGQMWVAYVAIEPYVRRLWPRMLVSWARLSGGRVRDPMVGRDVATGMLIGVVATLVVQLTWLAVTRFHLKAPPDVLEGGSLAALASHGGLGFTFAFMCSVTVLDVLIALVACLLVHLVIRNERVALPACVACVVLVNNFNGYLGNGWVVGVVTSLVAAIVIVGGLFRFGLLTTLAAVFTSYIMNGAPAPFDPSTWYGVRGMVFLAVITGLLGFSCWNALAGRPLFDDVLREGRAPGA